MTRRNDHIKISDASGPDPVSLRALLEQPTRPAGTPTYHALQGLLFTVASAPELIRPSEWLPLVFGERDAEYRSLAESQGILGQIMGHYRERPSSHTDSGILAAALTRPLNPTATICHDSHRRRRRPRRLV